jgi:hypothetical protein
VIYVKTGSKNKSPKQKNLLAMIFLADRNDGGGVSPGSISRSYVGKNPSIYPYLERSVRPALRGDRLPFRRVGVECAGFA